MALMRVAGLELVEGGCFLSQQVLVQQVAFLDVLLQLHEAIIGILTQLP